MVSRADSSGLNSLFRSLVAYRLVLYSGGVLAIATPLLLRRAFDIELSATTRTSIVGVSFEVMLLTYLGERRVTPVSVEADEQRGSTIATGRAPADVGSRRTAGAAEPRYSRKTRTIFAMSLIHLAIGIYVTLEVNLLVGVLFIVGAFLFGQAAFRRNRATDSTE